MTAPLPSNIEGSLVAGRYRVERLIGRGGMGSVWVARHLTLKRLVAIKFIHPELVGSEEALRRPRHREQTSSCRVEPSGH